MARRLDGIAGPDERVLHAERLVGGGWWVTTDQALYHVSFYAVTERVSFEQIRSVQSLRDRSPTIVFCTGRRPLVGGLRPDSRLVEQLRQLVEG